MLERVNELNILERDEQELNYEELVQSDEYVLITDPIKRIADMKY